MIKVWIFLCLGDRVVQDGISFVRLDGFDEFDLVVVVVVEDGVFVIG